MRRRKRDDLLVEPPGRLLAYDPGDWLPLVDLDAFDPDEGRNRRNGVPYGPGTTREVWQQVRARSLWSRARLEWCQRHGWPGGLTVVDLLQQQAWARRAAHDEWRG